MANYLAINNLEERCINSKFKLFIRVLEKYDTVCKIELEHESGFKMITLTENMNVRKIA